MVYINRDGRVLESRPMGLHTITDFFLGIFNFLTIFFTTLVNPNATAKGDGYTSNYRNTGGRGPPPGGGPRRRLGGFGGGGAGGAAGPPPTPMGGG